MYVYIFFSVVLLNKALKVLIQQPLMTVKCSSILTVTKCK